MRCYHQKLCLICLATLMLTQVGWGDEKTIQGIKLLPGYEHQPLQGIDSVVGKIVKRDGMQIFYEKGHIGLPGQPRLGGQFSDRARLSPKAQQQWYREQVIYGTPVHIAYLKSHVLIVTYPTDGINFSTTAKTSEDLADALLMLLTYPVPTERPVKQP